MHDLKEILKVLFRWIGILLAVIIAIRIIVLIIPAANPDNYVDKVKDSLTEDDDDGNFFDFPDPGSWGTYSGKPAEPTYLEANFDNNPQIQYTSGPTSSYQYYYNQERIRQQQKANQQ